MKMVGDLQHASNQYALRPVKTRPLSGMPLGRTQSNALMRSVATSKQPIAQVVDVADLAPPPGDLSAAEIGFQENHGECFVWCKEASWGGPSSGSCKPGRGVRFQERGLRDGHFLSTMSRDVFLRKIQLDGAAEIGPLMPKTAIW